MEWMDESKLSPTPSPELDEEYQARHDEEEMHLNARHRNWHEDLIWYNHLEMEERNLNLHAQQLDIREEHLCRRERICDRREVEVRAARMRGRGRNRGSH
jgi:hypothetical protein